MFCLIWRFLLLNLFQCSLCAANNFAIVSLRFGFFYGWFWISFAESAIFRVWRIFCFYRLPGLIQHRRVVWELPPKALQRILVVLLSPHGMNSLLSVFAASLSPLSVTIFSNTDMHLFSGFFSANRSVRQHILVPLAAARSIKLRVPVQLWPRCRSIYFVISRVTTTVVRLLVWLHLVEFRARFLSP